MLSRLGLQTNRVVKDRDEALVERGSTSSMYTNHLMEAGVGIASGGLAGIAVCLLYPLYTFVTDTGDHASFMSLVRCCI